MKDFLGAFIFTFVFGMMLFGLYFIGYRFEKNRCHTTWKDSGYLAKYSFFAGCRVSRDGIIFIPSSAVREARGDKRNDT